MINEDAMTRSRRQAWDTLEARLAERLGVTVRVNQFVPEGQVYVVPRSSTGLSSGHRGIGLGPEAAWAVVADIHKNDVRRVSYQQLQEVIDRINRVAGIG